LLRKSNWPSAKNPRGDATLGFTQNPSNVNASCSGTATFTAKARPASGYNYPIRVWWESAGSPRTSPPPSSEEQWLCVSDGKSVIYQFFSGPVTLPIVGALPRPVVTVSGTTFTVSSAGDAEANGVYTYTGGSRWDRVGGQMYLYGEGDYFVIAPFPDLYERDGGEDVLYAAPSTRWSRVTVPQLFYGEAASSLVFSSLDFAQNGARYRLACQSGFDSAVGAPATLTVERLTIVAILANSESSVASGTASFSVSVTGTGQTTGNSYSDFTYQWEKARSGTTSWAPITGALGSSISISALSSADIGEQYRVKVSCGALNFAYSGIGVLVA
jgi:hypothetical protein